MSPAMAATGAWFEPLLYVIDGDGIVTGADLGIMLVRLSTATAND